MAQSLVEVTAKDQNYILGTYARAQVHFVEGVGSYLLDDSGKKYLDLGSGISVSALGHQHPKVRQAIEKQLRSFVHVSNLYLNQSQVDLAEVLIANTPFDKVFFCNSGTEANEALIKFSRKYWFQKQQVHKTKIISFENFAAGEHTAFGIAGRARMESSRSVRHICSETNAWKVCTVVHPFYQITIYDSVGSTMDRLECQYWCRFI